MKTEEFIEKAKQIQREEKIDYSQVVYTNNRTPVLLIDEEYGEFWQTPYNHLRGQSHPLRRKKKISKNKALSLNDAIKKFNEVHKDDINDYSFVEYVNMHTKVKIIDRDYGEYWQEPIVHLKGCGHPKRGKEKQIASMFSNTDEFIKKSLLVHKNSNYDYSKVEYVNNRTKVAVTCNVLNKNNVIHGDFLISPDNFLQGKGCPKCGNQLSYAEDEIVSYLKKYVNIEQHDRKILDGKELDIYIPSKNIAIEYNGLLWHSEKYGKDKNYHLNKTLQCKDKGIKLIHIFEDEMINNETLVYNKLKHILKINDNNIQRIAGRKCIIKEISKQDAEIFLNKFHIQGFVSSTIYLGAFYKDILIGAMTFKKEDKESLKWDLNRFASDFNYICQGVGGKLFKYFIRKFNPKEIKSFADRRWTIDEKNNVYIQLGFKFNGYTNPEYRYYKKGEVKRFHKFGFRKQILNKKYSLPLSMTEKEMAEKLGYVRIWDCGLIKYVWKNRELF